MSMTLDEALKLLEYPIYKWSMDWDERKDGLSYTEAIELAISALRHQIWEEKLWHDAKTDPPKTLGLYYGKKDDTNSMYACRYRDGVWVSTSGAAELVWSRWSTASTAGWKAPG